MAYVAAGDADRVLAAMRQHPLGAGAVRIGDVVAGPARRVVVRTTFGARRVVPVPVGEQLPRVCWPGGRRRPGV